jgi:hypothetical protein
MSVAIISADTAAVARRTFINAVMAIPMRAIDARSKSVQKIRVASGGVEPRRD